MAKLLLKDPRVNTKSGITVAFRSASIWGHAEIVILALNNSKFDLSYYYSDVIQIAAKEGYEDVVKAIVESDKFSKSTIDELAIKSNPALTDKINKWYEKILISKAFYSKLPESLFIRTIQFIINYEDTEDADGKLLFKNTDSVYTKTIKAVNKTFGTSLFDNRSDQIFNLLWLAKKDQGSPISSLANTNAISKISSFCEALSLRK